MDFWSYYLGYWYWIYLLLVPFIIFSVKGGAPAWLKSWRLLVLVLILPFMTAPLDYARTQTIDDFNGHSYDCWVYGLYFFLKYAGISIIYTGLWEYGWRIFYKQTSWNIKDNLKYGIISNVMIFLSVLFFLNFIMILMGCKYCGFLFLTPLLTAKEFVYYNIIPLAC